MLYKRDTYVVVTVDTTEIVKNYGNEKALVEISDKSLVEFSDNRGDERTTGNHFKSIVDGGKDIVWIGIAKDTGDTVEIKLVKRKGGTKILRKDSYDDDGSGVVVGKIRDKSKVNSVGTEEYYLTFQINETGLYKIDPQLRMS